MQMVIAIFRPERLQAVKDSLRSIGVNAMTITHVVGRGEQGGIKFSSRVGSMTLDEIEKVKVEIVIDDDRLNDVITTIAGAAKTGSPGDGKIFVLPVSQSLKIREL